MLFKSNLYNIIFAFYVILCLLMLIYYYSKEKFELNKNNKEKEEVIYYLLVNGDYESTFRLAQMLLEEGKIVQPLYIDFSLKDCRNSLTSCKLKSTSNNYNNFELAILNKIIAKLKNNYPQIIEQDLLLPIKKIKFNELQKDKMFNEYFNELLKANNFNELIKNKQLAKKLYIIAKYSLYNDKYIDVTFSPKQLKSKSLFKFINKNLVEIKQKRKSIINNKDINKDINDIIDAKNYQLQFSEDEFYFTDKLRFPLINYSRTRMKSKFTDITQLAWSCINPDNKTGNNCDKCIKCKMVKKIQL